MLLHVGPYVDCGDVAVMVWHLSPGRVCSPVVKQSQANGTQKPRTPSGLGPILRTLHCSQKTCHTLFLCAFAWVTSSVMNISHLTKPASWVRALSNTTCPEKVTSLP